LTERRLGLLGGTFDPPHYGHLVAAEEAAHQLRLERVLFLPARLNPLKQGDPVSPSEDRCRMVELAIADNPLLELSVADLERPGPSYTVDLLRALRLEYGPDTAFFFLAGAEISWPERTSCPSCRCGTRRGRCSTWLRSSS
jgi:nicotinate-nucleotide adenylyltransferase